ncbi:hypothetical protein Tco_1483126 [Tanacetum coccineum]
MVFSFCKIHGDEEPEAQEESQQILRILQYKDSYTFLQQKAHASGEEQVEDYAKHSRSAKTYHKLHFKLIPGAEDNMLDLIRAKLEANARVIKSKLGCELQGEDFARKCGSCDVLCSNKCLKATKDSLKSFGKELQQKDSIETESKKKVMKQSYMLSERKYPLSAEVCKTMLKMKLLDGKMSEDCYRLLKMMEKQAGIRK